MRGTIWQKFFLAVATVHAILAAASIIEYNREITALMGLYVVACAIGYRLECLRQDLGVRP